MKKMIMIAALISGMLMPAQMIANNRAEAKPRVEFRKDKPADRKGKDGRKEYKEKKNYKNDRGFKDNRKNFNNRPVVVINKPAPRPAPRPCPPPPPPPPVNVYCNRADNAVGAAATVVGLAALIALIAD